MKSFGCIALLLLAAVPAFSAARKITVGELTDMLLTMHKEGKSDADVATALKQVALSEMVDRETLNALSGDVPGQLSLEQIYVLEARSATLPPPPSDIPTTPALDAATQQALLNKASAYASGTWAQLPDLRVTKTTLRFQDNVEALADASGAHSGTTDELVVSSVVNPYNFVHYISASDTSVAFEHGAEKLPVDKTQWGRNKMIEVMDPDPDLATVFEEAKDSASIKWERWERVNGKAAAVFSFNVPKKKSRMGVHVCCFPDIEQAGLISMNVPNNTSSPTAGTSSAAGTFRTDTSWNLYKEDRTGYHGEFLIDPETGIVVRMITEAEQKPSEMVHQVDTRIDYGPVAVGGKTVVVPVKEFVITEVVPNGEAQAGGSATRCTLFTSEYKNYQAGGGTASK
jgi:hypothetical protein